MTKVLAMLLVWTALVPTCFGGEFIVLPDKTVIRKKSIDAFFPDKNPYYAGRDGEQPVVLFVNINGNCIITNVKYYDILYKELINE